MREVMATLDSWSADVPAVALATVVGAAGSTPRPPGARLAVAPDGRMVGSVSGGCLEADVVEEALRTLNGEAPARVLHYGIADELGWSVGLACGGEVDVFVQRLEWSRPDPVVAALREALGSEQPVAWCTLLDGPALATSALVTEDGLVGDSQAFGDPAELRAAVQRRLRSGLSGVERLVAGSVFVQPLVPAPKLVIVGAVDTGSVLTELAKSIGYQVTVIDPRERFCTRERFPSADQLLLEWPERGLAQIPLGPRDAAVCLAHDPKFDDPTLLTLIGGRVGYIGAVGSRQTQASRRERLLAAGATPADLERIHGPVGLDLGAATPAEMALSILAELVAVRYGRSGGELRSAAAPA
ncbi:MAG TPA: XdhC/CoxI family protein [Candidatus Nanopelagicaceae bacterium]|nr:XdhC/CoxI family protein [Candidatus Nanopelagicaceae bacterium]